MHGEITARLVPQDQPLDLRDLGPVGFLADTNARVQVGSLHHIELMARDGSRVTLPARCAHSRRRTEVGAGPLRFAVGFAFLTSDSAAVDRMLDGVTSARRMTPESLAI
jgi:hypothetical protein